MLIELTKLLVGEIILSNKFCNLNKEKGYLYLTNF